MNDEEIIRPARYTQGIKDLLISIGLPTCDVLVVPSVQEWAQSVGLREPDPFRSAMAALRHDGIPTIVLLEAITPVIRGSITPALEIRGFGDEVARLEATDAFLEHLVLHEAAHLLLPNGASEGDCDRWAFDHLTGALRPDAAPNERKPWGGN